MSQVERRIRTYKQKEIEKFVLGRTKNAPTWLPADVRVRTLAKLLILDAVHNWRDLSEVLGHQLKRLQPPFADVYSIRINDQYRITFRWDSNAAFDVEVTKHYEKLTR